MLNKLRPYLAPYMDKPESDIDLVLALIVIGMLFGFLIWCVGGIFRRLK